MSNNNKSKLSGNGSLDQPGWRSHPAVPALLGAVAMWCIQPPLGWSWLAPLAPIPWLFLVGRRGFDTVGRMRAAGRRPYRWMYAGGVLHWALMMQGIRHPHVALVAGWLVLALYLGIYPLLFVVLTRRAVHRLRWPLGLAAPLVWVALEMARGWMLTGFSLGLLAHSVSELPLLIQIADLGGAYLVSGVLMLSATALWLLTPLPAPLQADAEAPGERRWLTAAAAALAVALTCGYGAWRLARELPEPTMEVALVQGARDVFYEYNEKVNEEMYLDYRNRTIELVRKHPEVRLVIWPESSLRAHIPERRITGPLKSIEPELSEARYREALEQYERMYRSELESLAYVVSPMTEVDLMVSGESVHHEGADEIRFNSTTLLRDDGVFIDRYYKMYPVMFGEYVPLGATFPFIYDLVPLPAGLTSGPAPKPMKVGGLIFSPSICFETTLPGAIRSQVAELRRQGEMPDVLVNPANDGWFHGSSVLDLHAQCVVFRAVENGRPVLCAANGGLTRWVDAKGRILGELARRTERELLAYVGPGAGVTLYQRIGDLFGAACVGVVLVSFVPLRRRVAA
ncbi:MAG: apolipoprotein N-acyltransferase [Planctomycetales bacterium]|nr:apolipoprotein N-acyltransferase [Planctomycetales bacterium]